MIHTCLLYTSILSELNYEIVYIGGCSNVAIERALIEKNHVKFYKTPLYGGNGMQRIIQQWKDVYKRQGLYWPAYCDYCC